MPQNSRLMRVSIAIVCAYLFLTVKTHAAINDPTKPIYSENGSSHIVTNPVLEEKKILLLQSILLGKNNKIAIINGEMLKEGESTGGFSMESIHKNHVMMKYKNNRIKLVLSKKVYINKLTGEVSE
jgi:hypothetical protein